MRLIWPILCALFLTGCWGSREARDRVETTHRVGVEAGKPVDVTTTTKVQEQTATQTTVDLAPMVASAVKSATGDLSGMVSSLLSRPVATPSDLAGLEQKTQASMSALKGDIPASVTGNSTLDSILLLITYIVGKGGVAIARKKETKNG